MKSGIWSVPLGNKRRNSEPITSSPESYNINPWRKCKKSKNVIRRSKREKVVNRRYTNIYKGYFEEDLSSSDYSFGSTKECRIIPKTSSYPQQQESINSFMEPDVVIENPNGIDKWEDYYSSSTVNGPSFNISPNITSHAVENGNTQIIPCICDQEPRTESSQELSNNINFTPTMLDIDNNQENIEINGKRKRMEGEGEEEEKMDQNRVIKKSRLKLTCKFAKYVNTNYSNLLLLKASKILLKLDGELEMVMHTQDKEE